MEEFNPLEDITKNALSIKLGYISNDQLYQLFDEVIHEINKRKEQKENANSRTENQN